MNTRITSSDNKKLSRDFKTVSSDEYYQRGSWANDKTAISFREYVKRVIDQGRVEEHKILLKLYGAEVIQDLYEGRLKIAANPVAEMAEKAMKGKG